MIDLTGLNMSHRKALKVIRMYAAHDQDCYPERLGRLYIINAPWIFPTFWKMCKIWLDQNTINKVGRGGVGRWWHGVVTCVDVW